MEVSMKQIATLVVLALMVSLCTLPAFGWGNATHMYAAHKLGVPNGTSNFREMYGSVLPDISTYMFDTKAQYLYGQTHLNPMPFYTAASSGVLKGTALGFLTHNGLWGMDYSAHTSAWTAPGTGYAVAKGAAMTPLLTPVLVEILTDAGLPQPDAEYVASLMAPELGHDLVEMGVDILVRRDLDPAIGQRMVLAARSRPVTVPKMFAAVYAPGLAEYAGISVDEAVQFLIGAEQEYRVVIMQYGAAFCLPEEQTIAMLAQQMAPVAESFIESGLAQNGITLDVTVTPEQVASMIASAVTFVQSDYQAELMQTIKHVGEELGNHVEYNIVAAPALQQSEIAANALQPPTEFSLAGNYPNPFNPSTTVRYILPTASHVRIVVYNTLGQVVASLVDADMSAGVHAATWNATDVTSGAYFCRMEAGAFTAVKRMMLVK